VIDLIQNIKAQIELFARFQAAVLDARSRPFSCAYASKFREVLHLTNNCQPSLLAWLQKRPLQAVELYDDWERILSTVGWIEANKCPGIYLRQVDLKGIHSKFIEAHLVVLSELLELVLLPE